VIIDHNDFPPPLYTAQVVFQTRLFVEGKNQKGYLIVHFVGNFVFFKTSVWLINMTAAIIT